MENRISKGYLGGTSPAALPPNRKSGWRYKPTLSAFTIILAILSIFALTALTPQGAMAKNGYDKDISDNHGTALWQDKNDTCGHCHANWDGGGARGDGAYYWKMFDYSSMDAGIHADLIDLDIFRVGVSTTTKISGEASTNPAPFYGAADKDGDGYVQLDYRTDLTGMPLYILIDTGSDGPTTTPTGWDVDDNDNLKGNTAWGTNTSVGTTDSTVPAQTTDLTAGSLAATSLPITWTASGDDGTTGTAHHYDIRFSTESIINTDFSYDPRNAAHWLTMWDLIDCSIKGTAESALLKTGFGSTGACASAQTVNQGEASPLMRMVLESAPQAPGNTENMTITAITPGGASPYTTIPNIIADGTTYWVALRTSDGVFAATGGGPFDRTDADVTSRTGFTENLSAVSNVIAMTAGAAGEAITAVSHSTWNSTVSTDITVTGLGLDATNANKLVLTDSTGATVATGTALNRTGETSLTGTFCEGGAISTGFHTIEVQTSGGVTKAAWVDAVNVTDGSACGGGGDSTTLSDGTGTAQTYAIQSESDVEGGVFNIAVVGTGDTVDSITIAIGANWADISNVHIYRDLSTLGTYDAESDISGSPVVPSSASVSFTTSEAISAGTNVDYLITYDFTGSAGDTNTYTANVSAFTATTNSTSGTDPTDGTTTLDASAPTTSALGDGGSYTFGDWVTGPQVSVTLSEADATSGVASSDYCRNASSGCVPGTSYVGAYNVPTAACTAGNVCTEYTGFRSLDNAGILQTTVEEIVNVDLKGPDAEAFSADVASATQCDVSYSALTNDPGIGSYDASPYQIVRLQGSDPAADCSSGTTITGGWTSSTTTVNDSGRTEGLPYNYRICYKDSLGNISTQATSICTPSSGPTTVLSDGTGTAQVYAVQSETDVEGGVFNIVANSGGDTVDSITIAIGANWADISNVHIYRDLSTLGTYDAESDISGSPVVPSSASVSFTTSETLVADTAVDYLITYDMKGSAGDTNTYTANVSAYTATTNPTSGSDATDGTTTLDASAPTTSALGDGGSYTFGDWVTGPQVSVTLSEADATSGVASSQYCRNASSGCVPGTGYSGAYNVPTAACTAGNVCTEYTGFRSLDNVGILQTTVEETVNIDLKGPDAEAFSADVASATQCDVSYSALTNDPGIGTYDASPYQIVRLQGSDPAADCSSGTTITGGWTSSTTTVNDSGRTEGLPYNYRICYKDSLGNISTQATSICTPAAGATTVLSDGTGTAQAYAVQSEADVEGGVFNIVANSGGDTVDSITIAIGANWADISNVHIYRDLSTLGTYDAESDISGSPVVPSSSSVSFTTNETLVADTAVDYLITYDFKAGAGDTNTYTANVSAFTVTTNPDSGSDPTDGTTTIDASAPSYAWVAPAASTYYMDGDGITFDVTVTETGSSVNGTDCTPLIDGVATEFTGTVTYGAGSCTGTITLDDPSALSDGAVSLTVEIGDNVGNSSQSAARSVNIDNTSPDAPTNVSPTNADYTSDTTPTFDWSDVADASGVTYEIQVDDSGAGYPSAEEDVTGLGTSTYTPAGALSETTHTWHARAVDNVGNPAGAWGPDWTITVDNTNPTVNTGTSSPADTDTGISVTTSITVEFLNGPIDCTTVNVDTSLYLEDDSGPTLIPAVGSDYDSCGDTQVVFTPASTLAQNQSHTVFYTGGVSDKAGNPLTPGNYSFVTQSVADGDPPDWDNFPTTEGVRKVIDDGTDGSMTVCFDSATDAVSTPESYFMYYNTASPASGGSNINMGTAPTAGSGNCAGYAYMYTKTGLDNGTKYFVTVRARDAVGNFTTNEDDMVGIPYYRTLGLTGYNMISLPGETSAAAPDSLFGDDLSYRRVMGWNGRYTLVNNSSGSFAEGAGYWLLNRSGSTSTLIDIDASGGDCNTYSCYTAQVTSPVNVSVYRGWTLIGNPCITNVTGTNISLNLTASSASCGGDAVCTFDEANSGGFIKNTSYRWNGTNYTTDAPVLSAGDSAEPWKGYWFYVKNTTPYVATIDITCSAQ